MRRSALDGLQNLRVGLFQLQLDVDFVVAGGLIGHIALASGVVLHRPLQRLGRAAARAARRASSAHPEDLHVHCLGAPWPARSRPGQAGICTRPLSPRRSSGRPTPRARSAPAACAQHVETGEHADGSDDDRGDDDADRRPRAAPTAVRARSAPPNSAIAPSAPTVPAIAPSTPYSRSSIVAISRLLAPSVLRMAAS